MSNKIIYDDFDSDMDISYTDTDTDSDIEMYDESSDDDCPSDECIQYYEQVWLEKYDEDSE